YIGGPAFGARAGAGNDVADIARLAACAHRFHAKVFVAFNTILDDSEIEAARKFAWEMYEAGADALIVQDMGLLELDLPPLQLHASTQTDIRTPEKARFLQDVGFSQMVLARELDLGQIRAIKAQVQRAHLEFFVHGALCVAYSGQCYISHAMTGRSANRGSCSQECRQPFTVTDGAGRIVAHDKHVLSLKDNDQSANLEALIDAGIRSFKIEGRYKDMATVKNVTAHYRTLLDALFERRPELAASSDGRCRYSFTPEPEQAFNRGGTDYFVNGRKIDIGAFDSPKHAGMPLGEVCRVGPEDFDLDTGDATRVVNNGDALTWWDRQGELQGVPVNVAERLDAPRGQQVGTRWRITPNLSKGQAFSDLKDLLPGTAISRNRDMAWERLLARPSSERRIAVDLTLAQVADGFELTLKDERGIKAAVHLAHAHEPARDARQAEAQMKDALSRLGDTAFEARRVRLAMRGQPLFLPLARLNALRRDGLAALEAARAAAFERLPRHAPVQPPVPYPDDTLSYLANVYNDKAAQFYARHGVKLIAAAYESHEELGEVSLMITKHCVRWSLSLCPKQAKGVTGVQGTVRAEPLTLQHGDDRFTLRFDCKPCEMHVVGAMQKHVLKQLKSELKAEPVRFYRSRPVSAGLSLGGVVSMD
ncbi:MAG: U32 family peptidase, partial [Roseateles sp.]